MPARTSTASGFGQQTHAGSNHSVITVSETNQLKARAGRLVAIIVWGVGTGWTLDIYDHASANTNPVWQWVTADGKGRFLLDLPIANGIRIVTAGTPGSVTAVWS